jgi:predicted nucleic acid-binding protein
MVLVDSPVWIDHLRGQVSEKTGKLRSLLADGDVVCTWIMAQEILQGAVDPKKLEVLRDYFISLPQIPTSFEPMSMQVPCMPVADGRGINSLPEI